MKSDAVKFIRNKIIRILAKLRFFETLAVLSVSTSAAFAFSPWQRQGNLSAE
jgi:hypothetical protein